MAKKSYTVGQVNGYIKNLISSDYLLGDIYVKGEVSNCKYHSSGHIYFSLKDETGSIMAVMFKSYAYSGLDFKLENGQQVVCHGSVNIYERDGRYQLYVKEIKLDGIGNLYERYEQLKQKLYEQTGAAIQDIRNIAKRRNPYVQLILYPAKVQGDGAAEDIAHGIEVLDNMGVDTIIIGRGGGSIEDLWAFNEEVVAWAIYHATTPIISGTGHEIDNTIADYAADLRAPTPSAACEQAIPDVMSTVHQVINQGRQMDYLMKRRLAAYQEKLQAAERHLRILNPKQRLAQQQIYLDDLSDRLNRAMKNKYDRYEHRVMLLAERLHGLSPSAKLINGFGYIEKTGTPVTTIKEIEKDDHITIRVHDGLIETRVTDVKEED